MEELKKIISTFVKKDIKDINEATVIDNTAIPGSIMVHRMYAIINKTGYHIKNYTGINNYGELLMRLNGSTYTPFVQQKHEMVNEVRAEENGAAGSVAAIGIDIEHIDNLPKVVDFREDEFYTGNFTNKEISYALLKPQTYETLSGLFCAKEALCKAENDIRSIPFNQIEIDHSTEGAPIFRDFSLSISHANGFSIAVAVKNQVTTKSTPVYETVSEVNPVKHDEFKAAIEPQKINYVALALIVSITISLVLLVIILRKGFFPNLSHHVYYRGKGLFPAREKFQSYWLLLPLQLLLS